jgi:hypothetical protein
LVRCAVDTPDEKVFGCSGRDLEVNGLERPHLGDEPE